MTELSLEYLVRKPSGPSDKPPLLLMLHGYGSNEQDLFSFAQELPPELLIISARAPLSLGFGSHAWYSINFEADSENFSNLEEAKMALSRIDRFIEEVIELYEPDEKRIFLMGFSQGTILSIAYALNHPGRIQHVLALSGYVNQKLIQSPLESHVYSDIDFFVSHGSDDQVIPVGWARRTPEFLDKLKIANVYKEYPIGHGVAPQNFFDMLAWIKNRL
jgi:phospholipase/carboxylesterase